MIPVEFLVLAIFQKYSSHMGETMKYPSLVPEDFNYEQLLKSDRILLFLYAEWCPFSRNASQHLASLEPGSYKIFRLDLSNEDNPLWYSLKIRRIPTLIAFDGGKEFWRREATYMMGLRKADFNEADANMKAPKAAV
jgi:thiol-disulfide isomerase/thioredoxin